jgi:periplasmic protein TonB
VINVALPKPNENPPPLPVQPIEAPQLPQTIVPEATLEYVPPEETAITPPQTSLPPPALTFTPARALVASHTTPDYPPVSRRLGEQGSLLLRLSITAQGTIGDAMVEKSSGFPRLDDAAVQWVKGHWRYQPALQGTKAVPSVMSAVVTFELH